MAQNATADQWTIDQASHIFTDLFDKLDIAFTLILGVAGILTFPPACFVYWRILTLKGFQGQYLMKLFVINGFSNMLMYLVNLVAVQFSNWPSMFGFYSWLKTTFLSLFLRFLQDYSISLMWQTMFFISLNRLLALKNQYLLSKYEFHYFIFASLTSVFFSAIISFPLFFSHYAYLKFPIADGIFAYIPYIPPAYKWTSVPAQMYQLSLAVGTLIVNAIICVFIMKMRKEYSAKMKSRPEQGLLLSSVIAVLMHVLNDILLGIAALFQDAMIAYFITLTVAVATTLPFWTMMICAKTMRRAVLNGTGFDAIRSSTVRIRSASRKTVSAAF